MKRKLSLFIAGVMMLSLLPAMNVFATTKNTVPIISTSVATDTTFLNDESNAPVLLVDADGNTESLTAGSKFLVQLTNAEWDLRAGNVYGTAIEFTTGPAQTIGGTFVPGDFGGQNLSATKGTMYVKDNLNVISGRYTSEGSYLVNFMDSQRAEIVMKNPTDAIAGAAKVYVPLVVKMKGAGAGTVTVSDSSGSGVSTTTATFATANEGGVTVTSADDDKQTSGTLVLADIKIDETVAGKIPMGKDANGTVISANQGKFIEFVAPSGFDWADPTTTTPVASVSMYGGFTAVGGSLPTFMPFGTNGSSKTTLKLDLDNARKSANARGQISVSNLVLKKDDASLGDIKVRVAVPGSGSSYINVGQLTKKTISMEVDTTKEMPQIVNGVYSKDSFDEKTQALDVVIKEGVRGAWPLTNEGGDFVLQLNDEVKFRGVEIKKNDGFSGLSKTTLELNNDNGSAANHASDSSITLTGGSMKLEDDKFTISDGTRNGTDTVELKLRVYVTVKPGYTGDITLSTSEDSNFGAGLSGKIATAINPFEIKATPTKIELGAMALKVNDFTIVENVAGGLQETKNDSYYSQDPNASQAKEMYQDLWLWLGLGSDGFGFNTEGLSAEVVSGDVRIDSIKSMPVGGSSTSIYAAGANGIRLRVKSESSTPSTVKISGASITTNRYLPSGNVELRAGGSAAANSNYKFNAGVTSTMDSDDYGSFDDSYVIAVKDFLTIDGGATGPGATMGGSYSSKVAVKVGASTMMVNGESRALSQPAFKKGGVTYVPARATCVALGFTDAQFNYDWTTKTVTIFGTPRGTAQFTVGSEYININGTQQVTMGYGATAQGFKGTTFLPFRALGEIVMNVPVDWDDATQTAYYNK